MPHATDGAISKNMGTQNIDVENQNTVRTSGLRKYFGLGLHTSDPLLNVVKWIVYFTEIGAIVIVAVPYFLLLFLLLRWCFFNPDAGSLVFFIFLSFYGGLVGWCYIHFMWVKPSRHLLLGIQQLSALKFLPWTLTVFVHSLPPAYLYYCYMTKRPNALPHEALFLPREALLPWPLTGELGMSSGVPSVYYREDPTYCHWVIVWSLILTPQFVVLVVLSAVIRVRRLNNERRRIESPSLLTEPEVGAFQINGSPLPDVPLRSQEMCLYFTCVCIYLVVLWLWASLMTS